MLSKHSFKIILAAALGAIAIFALPALAGADKGHRHHHHHDSTGTIASFDPATRVLTIDLLGGDSVSGLVDRGTKIRCEDEHSPDVSVRGRESEPGDDHGGHGEEAGDDNGGRGEVEPGDDHGGDSSGPGPSGSGPSGHDDNGAGANCTMSDLIPGTVVQKAELDLEHGQAFWDEVELTG